MSDKAYILGVDDEETNRAILEEIFEDNYEVICVADGQSCLDLLEVRKPDLILLDVNMPGLNGLDTCSRIREHADMADLPVIFVSALSTQEERLAGYEAGGDDYVTKPFVSAELVAKVELALKLKAEKSGLKATSDSAMSMAMTAMSNASEMGVVLRFLQDSFECTGYHELAKKVFEYTDQFGVSSSLVIKQGDEIITLFSDGIEKPLEASALEALQSRGRIYSFGNKIIFNDERASLLAKEIPDDEEKVGRIKDHLAVLLDGVCARLRGIEMENELAAKRQALTDAITSTHIEIEAIDKIHRQQQAGVTHELSDIAQNLDSAFMSLGLTQEQEEYLINIVSQAEKNTDVLYKKSIELDERFSSILSKLKSVL